MEVKNSFAVVAVVCLFFCSSFGQELNPKGRNVCKAPGSSGLVCCSGWGQLGDECLTPLCEGNFTCKENEVCVRPNECRCRHGYFGASCDTKCPAQFWGPDCKGKCNCHPNGQCDDLTGECTCNHNRWGPNCENVCLCQKGKCDQETGKCTCHPGVWGPQCNNNCYCSVNSVCDAMTGRCLCNPGWTGRNCAIQCNCNNSPCEQFTGRCQCRERLWGPRCERYCQCVHGKCNQVDGSCTCTPGYRGKFCREPCPAGFYGQNCRNRCGHCKGQQPCKVTEGRCITCDRGWNGTRCDQLCSKGFFGENCQEVCPTCKDGHHCDHIHGKCSHCNPGWIGDRCEVRCPNGTYGENCENNCSHCFNGICHVATGECLCDPGFYGIYCNMTCQPGQYGVNCNQTCSCHDKNCDPVSGACYLQPNQRMGVIAAGSLVSFLLIVLLSLLCCCCLCRHKDDHNKKAKRILCGRFSRISTKLPRIPLKRQKLPKVVVAHHDLENIFNCSFIEPPSVAEQPSPSSWSSQESFSSFESGDEGPVYCVPHEESVNESKEKRSPSPTTEKSEAITNEEDAGEYTSLKDTSLTKPEGSEQPLLKSSDSDGSTSGSESTPAALYARIARLSKQPKEDDGSGKDGDGTPMPEAKRNGKPPPSPGKPKPRPPDPSTKPKVSWIHGNTTGPPQPDQQGHGAIKALALPKEKKRSYSDGSAKNEERQKMKERNHEQQKKQEGKEADAGKHKPLRGKKSGDEHSSPSHMEHINGVVQNALKKISSFHSSSSEKKTADSPKDTTKEPPKSPKVLHPHMNSEAATLLAAQLKEKTQSINRNEGTGLTKTNGLSTPKGNREKPTPPQKAKRTPSSGLSQQSSTKPLLPTSSSLQKMVSPITTDLGSPEAKSPEKQDLNGSRAGDPMLDPTPKKTPIKKPPRKKGKEGMLDTPEIKTPQQKTAIMPPQAGAQQAHRQQASPPAAPRLQTDKHTHTHTHTRARAQAHTNTKKERFILILNLFFLFIIPISRHREVGIRAKHVFLRMIFTS
ncbi:scavenger receptor class F member 2 isoform X2 [Mastacembelus armatus]|uniref:scavenger receptor class F member 2 isoform X2 n=1 Tax=Mastacembelus armatus TaxID=205130 RepID=UPI000E459A0E|nr:scavenger receptor class F member 2 isoform X2 [Mastacembelus armatus]